MLLQAKAANPLLTTKVAFLVGTGLPPGWDPGELCLDGSAWLPGPPQATAMAAMPRSERVCLPPLQGDSKSLYMQRFIRQWS